MRIMVAVAWSLAGCSFEVPAAVPVDAMPDTPITETCGDGVTDPGEDCDLGNRVTNAVCDSTCQFTCGNGNLEVVHGESCDTGISTGTGSCPSSCDDAQVCTSDTLSGSDCTASCLNVPITAPVDGDGCCPAGANANTDDDCAAMCGNGVLEAGELCDTGITAGAGACPDACDDLQACTTDALINPNTCNAACTNTTITMTIAGDQCCPMGATELTDSDCSPDCGNGAVETGETCDTDINPGEAGACPTTCTDADACTTAVLLSGGTCDATCTFPAITMAIDGDGCCPPGANATTDDDCAPVCGNGILEPGEPCDDGNEIDTDACHNDCSFAPTAFRYGTLALRDPHVFVIDDTAAADSACRDATDVAVEGFAFNAALHAQLTGDAGSDGVLDLSPTLVFRPLTQVNGATPALQLYFASCTSPVAGTSCQPGATAPITLTPTNQTQGASNTCLTPIAGTTRPYTPAITNTTGRCFVTSQAAFTIQLLGVSIPLVDAQVAATYSGTPADQLVNGLLLGFVTESVANSITFPASIPEIGGLKLSRLLPGGDPPGAAEPPNCAAHSDKDTHAGASGWWVYFNFTAPRATWLDP